VHTFCKSVSPPSTAVNTLLAKVGIISHTLRQLEDDAKCCDISSDMRMNHLVSHTGAAISTVGTDAASTRTADTTINEPRDTDNTTAATASPTNHEPTQRQTPALQSLSIHPEDGNVDTDSASTSSGTTTTTTTTSTEVKEYYTGDLAQWAAPHSPDRASPTPTHDDDIDELLFASAPSTGINCQRSIPIADTPTNGNPLNWSSATAPSISLLS